MDDRNKLCCPNCGCTELSSGKKGFGTGKFVAGTLLAGPLAGVLTGGIGKNNPEVYCMRCGRKYKPGSMINGLITVVEYNNRKELQKKMAASGEDKEQMAIGCGTILIIVALSAVFFNNFILTSLCLVIGGYLFYFAKNKKKQRLQKEEELKKKNEQKNAEQQLQKKQQERLEKIEKIKEKFLVSCPECNTEFRGNMKFCPGCGIKVDMEGTFICPKCDAEMEDPSAKFCPNCGIEFASFNTAKDIFSTPPSDDKENAETSSFNHEPVKKSNIQTSNGNAGIFRYIAALYFPFLFLFSKFDKLKIFARIWCAVILLVSIILSISSSDKSPSATPQAKEVHTNKAETLVEKYQKNFNCSELQAQKIIDALSQFGAKDVELNNFQRRKDLDKTENGIKTLGWQINNAVMYKKSLCKIFLYISDNGDLIHLRAVSQWLIKFGKIQHNEVADTLNKQSANTADETSRLRKKLNGTNFEQYITKQFDSKYISAWDGSCNILKNAIKEKLNDPGSFKHVKTTYYLTNEAERHMTIQMVYRAKNGFNATITSGVIAVVQLDEDGNISKWISVKGL